MAYCIVETDYSHSDHHYSKVCCVAGSAFVLQDTLREYQRISPKSVKYQIVNIRKVPKEYFLVAEMRKREYLRNYKIKNKC